MLTGMSVLDHSSCLKRPRWPEESATATPWDSDVPGRQPLRNEEAGSWRTVGAETGRGGEAVGARRPSAGTRAGEGELEPAHSPISRSVTFGEKVGKGPSSHL